MSEKSPVDLSWDALMQNTDTISGFKGLMDWLHSEVEEILKENPNPTHAEIEARLVVMTMNLRIWLTDFLCGGTQVAKGSHEPLMRNLRPPEKVKLLIQGQRYFFGLDGGWPPEISAHGLNTLNLAGIYN